MVTNSGSHAEPASGSPNQHPSTAAEEIKPVATRAGVERGAERTEEQRKHKGGKQKRKEVSGGWKARNEDWREIRAAKRQKASDRQAATTEGGKDATPARSNFDISFNAKEIAAEERRPKRKVAVMIGYAGTGYLGLQINGADKTIERELFTAFIAAGAISKANADDPKKVAFARCARTDKGVHAAGNVVSLKLIVEDEDVVQKINQHLPEQIRVWGIQRTNNAFSCYGVCDSRWYEYLLPSYALLPPHPDSFLGKEIRRYAKERRVEEDVFGRLEDVKGFWEEVDGTEVEPRLAKLRPEIRQQVLEMLHRSEQKYLDDGIFDGIGSKPRKHPSNADDVIDESKNASLTQQDAEPATPVLQEEAVPAADLPPTLEVNEQRNISNEDVRTPEEIAEVEEALAEIRAIYVAAKRRYRITPSRLQKLQAALDMYLGTNNFHNYTVAKDFSEPSSKRVIRSFTVNPEPVQIRDTQWLSLKVHGQSFMMHQIRKMVAMAVMVVRCGAPLNRITQSYERNRISIPKAPSLGLLLERPVFDAWNKRAQGPLNKAPIDFGNYEKEVQDFKDRQIYARMWDVEERDNTFHHFFHSLDNFRTDYFLWATAGGFDVAYERLDRTKRLPQELDEDPEGSEGEDQDRTAGDG